MARTILAQEQTAKRNADKQQVMMVIERNLSFFGSS
jgi:hypothetical protein